MNKLLNDFINRIYRKDLDQMNREIDQLRQEIQLMKDAQALINTDVETRLVDGDPFI